jgi:hypothetical protein
MTTEQKQQPAEVMGLTLEMLLEAAKGDDAALTRVCARAAAVQAALNAADAHAIAHLNECLRACGKGGPFAKDKTAAELGISEADLAHRRTILAGASQAQHDLRMQVIALEEMRREFGRLTALTW